MTDQSDMNEVLEEIRSDLSTEENTTRTFTMVGGGLAGFLCLLQQITIHEWAFPY